MVKQPTMDIDQEKFNWASEHPYPRWNGLVKPNEYVIGKFKGPNPGMSSLEVIYHSELENDSDIKFVRKACIRQLIKVVKKEGGSSLGVRNVDEFSINVQQQLGRLT